MPADKHELSDAQKKLLVKWLNDQVGDLKCPLCFHNDWQLPHHLVRTLVYQEGGDLLLGGPMYPLAPLTCNHCGNTMFFNAITAGLAKTGEELKEKKEKLEEESQDVSSESGAKSDG